MTSTSSSLRRFLASLSLVLTLAIFLLPAAEARDLSGRLGLGYNAEFADFNATNGVPAISLKYGIYARLGRRGDFWRKYSVPEQ